MPDIAPKHPGPKLLPRDGSDNGRVLAQNGQGIPKTNRKEEPTSLKSAA